MLTSVKTEILVMNAVKARCCYSRRNRFKKLTSRMKFWSLCDVNGCDFSSEERQPNRRCKRRKTLTAEHHRCLLMEDSKTLRKLQILDDLNEFFKQRDVTRFPGQDFPRGHINYDNRRKQLQERNRRLLWGQVKNRSVNSEQRLQNQPLKRFYAETFPHFEERLPFKIHDAVMYRPTITTWKYLPRTPDLLYPLPYLSEGKALMRRPTIIPSDPLTEADEYFQYLISYPDLKPYTFDNNAIKSLAFYLEKYPLLLRVPTLQETATIIVNKRRVRSPELLVMRHRDAIKAKQKEMDEKVKELTADTDENFLTVLKSHVFDPGKWPWNVGHADGCVSPPSPSRKTPTPTQGMRTPTPKIPTPNSKSPSPTGKPPTANK